MPDLSTVIANGTFAARPAFSIDGRIYWATDTGQVFYDTGSAWLDVSTALTAASILAIQQSSFIYGADTGAANAYAIALSPATTLAAGSVVIIKAANANTGASTLALNGGAAKAIKKTGGTALAGGEIAAGQLVILIYDGTNFQIPSLDPSSGLPAVSAIQQESYTYAADTGSANAYAVALSPAPTLAAGSEVIFKAANANTGASTLAVNGGSTVAIKKSGSTALAGGEIASGQIVRVVYDGTNFQMEASAGGGGGGAVTSVALTVPSRQSVGGSPITGSGTLAITDNTQSPNLVFAGPASGSAAAPTFRSIAAADLPATAVTPGSYTNANLTVGADGRLTLASNGSAGGFQPSNLSLPPALSAFTWVNQLSATASNNGNSIMMTLPLESSLNWKLLKKSLAFSAPYSVAAFWKSYQQLQSATATGLYLYDGTKLMGLEITCAGSALFVRVEHITNVTTDSSTPFDFGANQGVGGSLQLPLPTTGGMYARWRNDGTNLYADLSLDGSNWFNIYSEALGSFITPTAYGFGGVCVAQPIPVFLSLQGWSETNSATL